MELLSVAPLPLPGIVAVRFGRFCDKRGSFCEVYRKSDFVGHPQLAAWAGTPFVQCNESVSKAGVVRGLHFQWDPWMGKLVRCVQGRMLEVVVDIRPQSRTMGKALLYEMSSGAQATTGEWLWVPPGFAHGNVFIKSTRIQYLCTAEYNRLGEAAISPLAEDIDWSLCDPELKRIFDHVVSTTGLMTDKDRNGIHVRDWTTDPRATTVLSTGTEQPRQGEDLLQPCRS